MDYFRSSASDTREFPILFAFVDYFSSSASHAGGFFIFFSRMDDFGSGVAGARGFLILSSRVWFGLCVRGRRWCWLRRAAQSSSPKNAVASLDTLGCCVRSETHARSNCSIHIPLELLALRSRQKN